MIQLEHINTKSFHDFSLTDQNSIKQVNIMFGRNGSGKSALSDYLQHTNSDGVRVFNTDFVEKNLKMRKTVEGTNLIIGADQLNLSKVIGQSKAVISALTMELAKTNQRILTEKRILSQRMKTILDQVKKDFDTSKINQKQNTETDPAKAVELWKADITKFKNLLSDYSSSADLEKDFAKIQADRTHLNPVLSDFNPNRREALNKSMMKVIFAPDSPITAKIVSWLQDGLHLHNLDHNATAGDEIRTCLFCGNSFQANEARNKINEKISSDHANLLSAINRLKGELESAIPTIVTMGQSTPLKNATSAISCIQVVLKALKQKESETDRVIQLPNDYFSEIDKLNEEISGKLTDLSEKEQNLISEKMMIENLARRKAGELISSDQLVKEHLAELQYLQKICLDEEFSQDQTQVYLSDLNSRTNNLRGFMEMINQTLYSLGLGFELMFSKTDKNSFDVHLRKLSQNEIDVHSLSEGEIRLIAFVKFYFGLFSTYCVAKGKRKATHEFNSDVQLIILDDPITSIDSNNRYFMTTLINKLLLEILKTNIDVVILTHSIYDYHNFAYSMGGQVGHFRILKNSDAESEVESVEDLKLKNYSDDYRAAFDELIHFCCLNAGSLPEAQQYIRYGNQSRFVLETHSRSNYNIDYVTNKSRSEIMEAYCVAAQYTDRVSQMLNTINALSHGISYSWDFVSNISANEIQKAARIMIWMLYKKDKQHVKAMAPSGWQRFEQQIRNWNLD
ncbi:AAA family ATPase [Oenococcus oeni]|uniref:AAA family ATPase n=1 Tax=Oenococcus oeni TaxID=1247 RepID=UPI001C922336|nr:AAA family ATPase [Oenococcus oeni]